MAPSPRGLVIVLTFWVVAWPDSSIRTGSPFSGWWGTQEALALRQAARAPTFTGDFAEFERVYRFHYGRFEARAANRSQVRSIKNFFETQPVVSRLQSVSK
jgi:hypothetical protein